MWMMVQIRSWQARHSKAGREKRSMSVRKTISVVPLQKLGRRKVWVSLVVFLQNTETQF